MTTTETLPQVARSLSDLDTSWRLVARRIRATPEWDAWAWEGAFGDEPDGSQSRDFAIFRLMAADGKLTTAVRRIDGTLHLLARRVGR